MNTTRSATRRAKPISWVTTSIVMPSSASWRIDGEHLADQLRVEGAGDLVEQHHVRVHAQRPGDGHALLLAARQADRVLVGLVAHADPLQHPPGLRLRLGLRPAAAPCRWAIVQLARTVRCGNRLKDWNTMPMLAADAVDVAVGVEDVLALDADLRPDVGSSRRLTQRSSVDLPDPDGPITHTTSRGCTVSDTPAQHLEVAEALVQVDELDRGPPGSRRQRARRFRRSSRADQPRSAGS